MPVWATAGLFKKRTRRASAPPPRLRGEMREIFSSQEKETAMEALEKPSLVRPKGQGAWMRARQKMAVQRMRARTCYVSLEALVATV